MTLDFFQYVNEVPDIKKKKDNFDIRNTSATIQAASLLKKIQH